MNLKQGLIACSVFLSANSFAENNHCKIAGIWKHADKQAWLEVSLITKTVTIKSHLDNPKANGLSVIKNLTAKRTGLMYDASTDSYVPVKLAFNGCKQLEVTNNNVIILTLNRE